MPDQAQTPQSTAYRASQASSRRFTLTLYDHEAQALETIRERMAARSLAEALRRLIVAADVRLRLAEPPPLFDDDQTDHTAPRAHDPDEAGR